MYTAAWLICYMLSGSCDIVRKDNEEYFQKEQQCLEYADKEAYAIISILNEAGIPAQVQYKCFKRESI